MHHHAFPFSILHLPIPIDYVSTESSSSKAKSAKSMVNVITYYAGDGENTTWFLPTMVATDRRHDTTGKEHGTLSNLLIAQVVQHVHAAVRSTASAHSTRPARVISMRDALAPPPGVHGQPQLLSSNIRKARKDKHRHMPGAGWCKIDCDFNPPIGLNTLPLCCAVLCCTVLSWATINSLHLQECNLCGSRFSNSLPASPTPWSHAHLATYLP